MPPTIYDVAAHAGVSASTVSRVLNNTTAVSDAKRRRVEAAVRALGYRANPNASSLRGQRTGGIGVLLPYLATDFFSGFLHEIDGFAQRNGLFLMATSSHRSESEFKTVLHALHNRVDGVIVMSTDVPARIVAEWHPPSVPIVYANTDVSQTRAPAVNFDNRGGMARVADHLVALGHRRIAFVCGPPHSYDATERRTGFRAALAAHGLEPALEVPGDYTLESGTAAAAAVLAASPRPTAVAAANDLSAAGLIAALHHAGLRVPDDAAVAGFDDVALARLNTPQLTTVRVPLGQIGRRAVERLAALMAGERDPDFGDVVLPTELVVRGSTRPGPLEEHVLSRSAEERTPR